MKATPILLPYGSPVPDLKGGVATPNLVYDPVRDKKWMVFTGWSDPKGLKRECYVAAMDDAMNVDLKTCKKILPMNFPVETNYTNNTVRCAFNQARDEYYVTSSHGPKIILTVFDGRWERKGHKELLDFGKVKDAGFPVRPFGVYGAGSSALGVSPNLASDAVDVYMVRDFDDVSKAKAENLGEVARWGKGNDVIDLVTVPRFQIFVEHDTPSKWALQTYVGPTPDEVTANDYSSIATLGASIMPLLGLDDSFVQIGHPHYTTLPDGRPKMLVAAFRDSWSTQRDTSKEGYHHEIWSVGVKTSVFDPRSYPELKGSFAGTKSKWYYVAGGRKLLVHASAPGTLESVLSLSDDPAANDITKGLNVIDSPATWVRLSFSSTERATLVVRH